MEQEVMNVTSKSFEVLNQYFILATLLMPAIIMITIRRWITPINCNFFQDFYRFIGYAMFNFVVFGCIVKMFNWNLYRDVFLLANTIQHPSYFLYFAFLVPVILGLILAGIDRLKIMDCILKPIFKKHIETNGLTTWEEFFSENHNGDINVVLKDGTQIVGHFAKPSKVSSSIEHKDIWIEEVVRINSHEFKKTMSMWINGNNISHIILDKTKPINTNSILNLILKTIGVLDKDVQKANDKLDKILKTNKTKE